MSALQKKPLYTINELIIKMVIQHGGKMLYENVDDGNGGTVSLTLAQFVDYDLRNDNLQFAQPIYNKILAEAVEHSADEDFDSERYFTLHPDYEISSLAIKLCTDQVILSKSRQMKTTQHTLREQIDHLLLDFRNEYLKQRIALLTTEINQAGDDMDRQLQLLEELQETQKLRTLIARQIGSNIAT